MASSGDKIDAALQDSVNFPPLSRMRIFAIYLWILSVMIAWHGASLTSPPYDDFACVYFEAVWLAENDFDYSRLRNEELPFRRGGGPVIYLTSIVPSFFALLIKYGPGNPANLVMAHLVMLGFASLILLAVFLLVRLRKIIFGEVLVISVLASHPLFQSQSEMLGVDVPMTAMAMLAVYFTARGRFLTAVLASAAAFAMKPTGLVVAVALAGYFFLRLLFSNGHRDRLRSAIGLVAVGCLLLVEWLVLRWSGIFQELDHPIYAELKPYFPILEIAPDLVVIPWTALLAFAAYILFRYVLVGLSIPPAPLTPGSHSPHPPLDKGPGIARIQSLVRNEPVGLLCAAITIGVLYGVFFQVQLPVPRYFLLALATSVVLLGQTFLPIFPRATAIAFTVWAVLNLANSAGWFYPSLERLPCARIGAIWERSLEYRSDLAEMQRAIQAMEEKRDGAVVLAPHHWTHALAMPELGYVSKAIPGYSTSEYTRANFPPVARLMLDRPRDLIIVSVDNLAGTVLSHVDIPPREEEDEILYQGTGVAPIDVYRKHLPASNRSYDDWCLEHLWYGRTETLDRSLTQALTRAEILDSVGRSDLGTRLLEKNLARDPDNPERLLDLAEQRLLTSSAPAARLLIEPVRATHPNNIRAQVLWARMLADTGDTDTAFEEINEVVRVAPDRADSWFWKGIIQSRRGQWDDARSALAHAKSLDARLPNIDFELAKVEILSDNLDSAAEHLDTACRQSPYDSRLHYLLASVLAKLDRTSEADTALATAVRLDPDLRRGGRLPDPGELLRH